MLTILILNCDPEREGVTESMKLAENLAPRRENCQAPVLVGSCLTLKFHSCKGSAAFGMLGSWPNVRVIPFQLAKQVFDIAIGEDVCSAEAFRVSQLVSDFDTNLVRAWRI